MYIIGVEHEQSTTTAKKIDDSTAKEEKRMSVTPPSNKHVRNLPLTKFITGIKQGKRREREREREGGGNRNRKKFLGFGAWARLGVNYHRDLGLDGPVGKNDQKKYIKTYLNISFQ